ncbi:MAG: DUF2510 domain-containing protein [Iamia sp.]
MSQGGAARPTFTDQDAATAASLEATAKLGAAGLSAMSALGRKAVDAVRQERATAAQDRHRAESASRKVVDDFHDQMLTMATAHHETFTSAWPGAQVDADAITTVFVEDALESTSALRPRQRRDRVAEAEQRAQAEIAARRAEVEARQAALRGNDPAIVLDELDLVFEDNQAPAVAVDCEGDRVTLVVTVPSEVPATRPQLTDKGKLVNKPWPAKEAASFHATVIASAVLATVKETWATCPSISFATVVAVADAEQFGIRGLTATQVFYRGTFGRESHTRLAWNHIDPVEEIVAAQDVAFERKGRHKVIRPLSLDTHPDLREFLSELEAAWNKGPEADEAPSEAAPAPLGAGPSDEPTALAATPAPAGPAPGWYSDPWWPQGRTGDVRLRWWNGADWTDHVHPAGPAGVTP